MCQILTREHDKAVIDIIRANVDDYDEVEEDDDDDEEDDKKVKARPHRQGGQLYARPMTVDGHLVLGAPQKVTTIAQLAAEGTSIMRERACSFYSYEQWSRLGSKVEACGNGGILILKTHGHSLSVGEDGDGGSF